MLTLGSLFDGIGGWLLAAKHAKVKPVWASEIGDFPAAVTAHHFPDVRQMGDITKINVDELEPVDIICAGSPCQDLSVAGKREGLAGERSGLFRTAIKLVHRLRARTGKPRFFVWENVPGAFSSNGGADFRTVLEEIGQTEIPMPERNKWAQSGVVQCDECEIAWRVLDAQYWGVPQRRKRIFLVADFAAADRRAAEILFVEQGLHGNFAESEGEGQESAGGTGKSVDSASGTLTPWDVQRNRIQSINGTAATLCGGAGQGTHNGAVFDTRQVAYSFDSKASNSMKSANPYSGCRQVEIAKCLDTTMPNPSKNQGGIAVMCKPGQGYLCVACYGVSHRQDVIRHQEKGTLPCLTARAGTGGNNLPVVHSYCIAGNTIDRQPQNGGNGTGNQEELAYTLNTADRHAVVSYASQSYIEWREGEPTATLRASGGSYGRGSENLATYNGGTVRRLTPLECERLQGLPDGYTDIEFNGKPAPDSRRYKAIGNGMAQPCADFVIRRIVEKKVLTTCHPMWYNSVKR